MFYRAKRRPRWLEFFELSHRKNAIVRWRRWGWGAMAAMAVLFLMHHQGSSEFAKDFDSGKSYYTTSLAYCFVNEMGLATPLFWPGVFWLAKQMVQTACGQNKPDWIRTDDLSVWMRTSYRSARPPLAIRNNITSSISFYSDNLIVYLKYENMWQWRCQIYQSKCLLHADCVSAPVAFPSRSNIQLASWGIFFNMTNCHKCKQL